MTPVTTHYERQLSKSYQVIGLVAPKTYEAGNREYFAKGVKLWVFESYPTKWHLDANVQGQWLADALKG